jgi:hypothetical protein
MAFASVGACCAQDSRLLPNDTAPVDWAAYERLWVKGLPRATNTEPILSHFDEQRAIAFLDDASLQWTRQNKCATCHTNVPYLMVRPLLSGDFAAMQEIRSTVKVFASKQQEKPGKHANFLIAAAASALAVNDARAGHELDPDVRKMFDYLTICGLRRIPTAHGDIHLTACCHSWNETNTTSPYWSHSE